MDAVIGWGFLLLLMLGATLYGMYGLYRWAKNAPPIEHKPTGYYFGEK